MNIDDYKGENDGHITVYKFTTNFKAHEGTSFDLIPLRTILGALPGFRTSAEAIDWARKHPNYLHDIERECRNSERCIYTGARLKPQSEVVDTSKA